MASVLALMLGTAWHGDLARDASIDSVLRCLQHGHWVDAPGRQPLPSELVPEFAWYNCSAKFAPESQARVRWRSSESGCDDVLRNVRTSDFDGAFSRPARLVLLGDSVAHQLALTLTASVRTNPHLRNLTIDFVSLAASAPTVDGVLAQISDAVCGPLSAATHARTPAPTRVVIASVGHWYNLDDPPIGCVDWAPLVGLNLTCSMARALPHDHPAFKASAAHAPYNYGMFRRLTHSLRSRHYAADMGALARAISQLECDDGPRLLPPIAIEPTPHHAAAPVTRSQPSSTRPAAGQALKAAWPARKWSLRKALAKPRAAAAMRSAPAPPDSQSAPPWSPSPSSPTAKKRSHEGLDDSWNGCSNQQLDGPLGVDQHEMLTEFRQRIFGAAMRGAGIPVVPVHDALSTRGMEHTGIMIRTREEMSAEQPPDCLHWCVYPCSALEHVASALLITVSVVTAVQRVP